MANAQTAKNQDRVDELKAERDALIEELRQKRQEAQDRMISDDDIQAKRESMAREELETARKADYEAQMKEYKERRAAAMPEIEIDLENCLKIQKKIKKYS